jgi:glycosyltransferase involved in cell wall biosynthesis
VSPLRVLIVSENISMSMGGESSLPYYYAKLLSRRGVEVWLACHERVESEVIDAFSEFRSRIIVVRDTGIQKLLFRLGNILPYRVRDLIIGQLIHFSTQIRIRRSAMALAKSKKIDVVLEPAPITPKGVSFMFDVGVPVVMGPMCGGMNFPPAFIDLDSRMTRIMVSLGRWTSHLANRIIPGKLLADVLLVANSGTMSALPTGYRGKVIRLFESGVDLDLWRPTGREIPGRLDATVKFAFSGRFVDWKGIQYLLPAFAKAVSAEPRCRLDLIGGGELDYEVREMIREFGIGDSVRLHGWVSRTDAMQILRDSDVFVMPSLRECGGTAILEAMALGKPVVTTDWGGPADYVTPECGLLVSPTSKTQFIDGLTEAILKLARSPALRDALGHGGMARVREEYLDWESKADRMLEILTDVV